MLRLYILALSCVFLAAGMTQARPYSIDEIENVQTVDQHRYTSNPDGILSGPAVTALDLACDSLRTMGLAQIAIVAVDEITPSDVFTFAHSLFTKWGVGSSKSNNGLGILLVRSAREIRFVTGDGMEGILTDAMSKRIQQKYMVEPFSVGDYDLGMIQGMTAIASVIHSGGEYALEDEDDDQVYGIVVASIIGMALAFLLLMWIISRLSRRCPKCGRFAMETIGTHNVGHGPGFTVVRRTRVCSKCGFSDTKDEHVSRVSSRPGIGGGMMFGGMGGGHFGGGFGGGHFGGGGAGSKF